jgi:hypothetical protein
MATDCPGCGTITAVFPKSRFKVEKKVLRIVA